MTGEYRCRFKLNKWPTHRWVKVKIRDGSRKHSSGDNGYVMDFKHEDIPSNITLYAERVIKRYIEKGTLIPQEELTVKSINKHKMV